MSLGDAREVLLTTRERYDVIFSEPSNPYRAGVSSLYTAEYYEAARSLLLPRGLFVQWIQAYETDGSTMRTVLATVHSAFPHVVLWRTTVGDMLLEASVEPIQIDAEAMRARLATEPYKSAMAWTWRAEGLEGFLSRFIADERIPKFAAENTTEVNRDDRNILEFAYARTVGRGGTSADVDLMRASMAMSADGPPVRGAFDDGSVRLARAAMEMLSGLKPSVPLTAPKERAWAGAFEAFMADDPRSTLEAWNLVGRPPRDILELEMLALTTGKLGDDRALALADKLQPRDPFAAFVLLLCGAGGLFSAALCHLWNPRRGDRKNMRGRYQQNRLINMIEAFSAMGWAALAVCLNGYLAWTPLALAFAFAGPGVAWVFGRGARREFG